MGFEDRVRSPESAVAADADDEAMTFGGRGQLQGDDLVATEYFDHAAEAAGDW